METIVVKVTFLPMTIIIIKNLATMMLIVVIFVTFIETKCRPCTMETNAQWGKPP